MYDLESASAHERSANASEKDARARVYAEVKRHLSARDVVICDAAGGNYIKGWRYQLFCEAKALRTPCCVVHVGTPVATARGLNEARLAARGRGEAVPGEEAYERATWENLVFRYEEPNGMVRWDSPLFTVGWEDESPDCAAIREALFGGAVVRPNAATLPTRHVEEGYLYRLDRETQAVVTRVLEWVKDHEGEEGGVVDMEEEAQRKARVARRKGRRDEDGEQEEKGLELVLPQARLGVPVLQRLRRQYIQLQRLEPSGAGRVREGFVGFLNAAFEKM